MSAPNPLPLAALTPGETKLVDRALRVLEAKRLKKLPLLDNKEDLAHYLELRFAGLAIEQRHVLYLDQDGKLLEAETEAIGNQKQVMGSVRHVVQRALVLGADKVVFAHNHPTGNQTPSQADVMSLDYYEKLLGELSITLLDSFVVVPGWITSIKDYRQSQRDEALQCRAREARESPKTKAARLESEKAAIKALVSELFEGFCKLSDKVAK